MLSGYPDRPTVAIGGTLRIHVASNDSSAPFRAYFFRQGPTLKYVGSSQSFTAYVAPLGSPDQAWGWPGYDIQIPSGWKQGVYVALLAPPNSISPQTLTPQQLYSSRSTLLCVLQDPNPGAKACILYKLSLFTYQAYNQLGSPPATLYSAGGRKVTLHRPGGGCGGDPWDNIYPDEYEPNSARQTFAHWDAPFIRWIEGAGYDVEYCTDLDVHHDPGALLNSYRLLLSVGHDEYWSGELRGHIESFIANGGNVAFFSGNTCWWRVHLTDSDTAITCDKPATDHWQLFQPENSVTGVSYNNAGGWWAGQRQQLGFTVQYASHWVYQGTGLADGNTFGQQNYLVGYECDGAALSPSPGPLGYAVPSHTDGTPSDFLVLGLARLAYGWNDWLQGPASAATLGLYTRGGIVFTAATTDWARALAAADPQVVQITRNVIDRLRSRSVRIRGLSTSACGPTAVEGSRASFRADISGLPNANNLTYQWTSSAGQPGPANLPVFDVTFPSPPVPVTITVTIKDGTDCPGFGTLTITPLTKEDALRLQFICELRHFAIGSQIYHGVVSGVRDRVPMFVDPLWDPIKGELTHRFFESAREIKVALAANKRIGARLERLLASVGSEKRKSAGPAPVPAGKRRIARSPRRRPRK